MPNRVVDITGQHIRDFFVIGRAERPEHIKTRQIWWLCRCVCGRTKVLRSSDIRNGDTKSCGCELNSIHKAVITKHGGSARDKRGQVTTEYASWAAAKSRCHSVTNKRYHEWGGRGIAMCEEWRNDFAAFRSHMGPKPKGTSLDRIDNDRGYEPGNCRWATPKQQANNRRRRAH